MIVNEERIKALLRRRHRLGLVKYILQRPVMQGERHALLGSFIPTNFQQRWKSGM